MKSPIDVVRKIRGISRLFGVIYVVWGPQTPRIRGEFTSIRGNLRLFGGILLTHDVNRGLPTPYNPGDGREQELPPQRVHGVVTRLMGQGRVVSASLLRRRL